MKRSVDILSTGKGMFSQLLLLTILLSCSRTNLKEPMDDGIMKMRSASIAGIPSDPNYSPILFEETFEDTTWANFDISQQWGTPYGFQVVTSPVVEGTRAGRFELRDTDPEVNNGTRAEVKFPEITNMDRWYAFSVYFPSLYYEYDSRAEVFTQWHQAGNANPSISLLTRYDRILLDTKTNPEETERSDLGDIKKDKWLNFVMHIRHAPDSTGLVEVWLNGVKILNKAGGNSYSGPEFEKPQWKLGIYKWDWSGTETTDTRQRVIYFDNVRLGSELATYNDMVRDPTNPPPSQDTLATSVASFTLINSGNEQDVIPVENNSFIDLDSLGFTRANIRASLRTAAGSAKFKLSGPVEHTFIDNAEPFALFGDDGEGNYYYGNHNPLPDGKYILHVTPYSGTKGSGTAEPTTSIKFTISNQPPPDEKSPIKSFTLVDAATESDIMTITNGAKISLSAIGTSKLNIRANLAKPEVESVNFELTGQQTYTFTDQSAPFALHGDSKDGNYYYGDWNPPALGTYTLRATPDIGYAYKISFTFIE